MLGVIDILVWFEHISNFLATWWEYGKEELRKSLGPSPKTTYLLFDNDEVIPEGREHCKYAHVSYYVPQDSRIHAKNAEAPYKRLPWISVQHCIGDHIIDLSDWLSEIRANTAVSLLALLRIYSQSQNMHLPETDHALIKVITRDGDELEYKFVGKTKLLKRIEPTPVPMIQHRPTLPYDVMDGGLFF